MHNIFVNSLTDNCLSGIFISDVSYHLPIFYIAQDKINISSLSKYFVKTYRDISDDAIVSFATTIDNTSWDNVDVPDDASASIWDVSEMKLMTKFVKRLAAKIYFLVLLILGLL